MSEQLNVFGHPLACCCTAPLTGFYRNGYCLTGEQDTGRHVICARMTDDFLRFTLSLGNDLITPRPEFRFNGLKAGDKWCLCAVRWREAYFAGVAPHVFLNCTHQKALEFVTLEQLMAFAIDAPGKLN